MSPYGRPARRPEGLAHDSVDYTQPVHAEVDMFVQVWLCQSCPRSEVRLELLWCLLDLTGQLGMLF